MNRGSPACPSSTWAEAAFTVGRFSVLDARLDLPMDEVLGDLQLGLDVEEALLQGTGPIGHILRLVQSYEAGVWEEATQAPMTPIELRDAYVDSLRWSADTLGVVRA